MPDGLGWLADFAIFWVAATFAYRAGIRAERRGDAGGMEAMETFCAFCGWAEHTPGCPWEAARRALNDEGPA